MIKIAFDVMGADKGVNVAIEAGMKFLSTHPDLELFFYGDQEEIKQATAFFSKKYKVKPASYEVVATSEVIDMHGSILDIRRKKDASLVRSLEAVKEKKVDAMLTGGASAAFIAGAQIIVGNITGVKRSGFMPTIPSVVDNKVVLLLDAGANLDNSSEELHQYAQMASVYAKAVNKVDKPLVGLMNVGSEESKGKDLQKETYKLLEADESLNFYGNLEPRYITSGIVDILIADGYSGNIALKSIEGMAKNLMLEIKNQAMKNFYSKMAALGMKPVFKKVAKKFDYKNHAGAILLGIDGIVFKSHGSSDLKSFEATLRMTYEAAKNDVVNKLKMGMKIEDERATNL